ncbi:MAG TPA: alpha/beta fold hydrolase [Saprospiraceae bacterium]|nr:alpha/beta fold hydrolase [Saprospiraceae bacterium]
MQNTFTKWFKKTFIPKAIGFYFNVFALIAKKKAGANLLSLISKPRKGRIQDFQRKMLNSCSFKESVQYKDLNIQTYHWVKPGLKILLCHGWESNSWRWRKLLKNLEDTNYYFIAMDGPAHGATTGNEATGLIYGEMIAAVVEKYKIDVIIGHSFGGYGALYYLAHFKNTTVKYLISLASPDRWLDIAEQFYKALGVGSRLKEGIDLAFNEKYPKNQAFYSGSNFAKEINIPGIVIHDIKDNTNVIDEGRRIAASWKGAILFETNGFDHALQSPEVFSIIRNNLETLN